AEIELERFRRLRHDVQRHVQNRILPEIAALRPQRIPETSGNSEPSGTHRKPAGHIARKIKIDRQTWLLPSRRLCRFPNLEKTRPRCILNSQTRLLPRFTANTKR